jgi:hypothetical protein
VSSGPDGDPHKQVLPEEDDWFATPFQDPVETDEIAWQDDAPEPPVRSASDGLGQRQAAVVLAVLAIVALIAVGFLVARSIGGSGDTTTTPPTSVPATTPTDTTPADTTPADTTPASTTPTTTTPTVTSVPTDATLRPGSSGASVTSLQQALSELGYEPGAADGKYGPATTEAVTAFQKAEGLTEDGIAGPATLAAINTALAAG